VPLYSVDSVPNWPDVLLAPAGLAPVVVRTLREAGLHVRIMRESRQFPKPTRNVIKAIGAVDDALLQFVRDHDGGLIRYDSRHVDPAWLVAQLVLAYPGLNFVVVDPRCAEIRRFTAGLRRHVPDAVAITGSQSAGKGVRVIVATPVASNDGAVELHKRDVLIALDPIAMLGEVARWFIPFARSARCFALLDRAVQPAPYDADCIAAIFGLAEVDIPRHGHVFRPVRASFLRISGGPPLPAKLSPPELRRRAYWEHPVRNRRLARLADLIACGDHEGLARYHSDLASRLKRVARPRVLIVVENIEHAVCVARRLPHWPVLVHERVSVVGLPERDRALLAGQRWRHDGRPRRLIATVAGLASLESGRFDVVIRAEGGIFFPDWLEAQTVIDNRRARCLELVDFMDLHHPLTGRWSRLRQRAYADRGMMDDRLQTERAVDRFLGNHLGVEQ
jgi:hypothetical protein